VALDSGGHRLAAGGALDGLIKVWDVETGREIHTRQGHTSAISSLDFSPDGRFLAGACSGWEDVNGAFGFHGSEVKVWDTVNDPDSVSLKEGPGGVNGLAFSPDGKLVAGAATHWDEQKKTVKGGQVQVFDLGTRRLAFTLDGHAAPVTSVAFSPDGTQLASASQDQTIKVWIRETRREARSLRGHGAPVTCVAFHPDGRRLASAARDSTVRLWDLTTGKEMLSINVGPDVGMSVAFSPDGRYLAVGGGENAFRVPAPPTPGLVRVWDVASGREAFRFMGHTGKVRCVAFSPKGRWLASAAEDRSVRLWDLEAGRQRYSLQGHTGWVVSLAFSGDGRRLATAGLVYGYATEVKLWDPSTGQETYPLFKGPWEEISGVAFSPSGEILAVSYSLKGLKLLGATGPERPGP
jgi:WD40 repeat protein